MLSIDRPGSYVELLRENGIVVNIKKLDSIEVEKYTGAISSKYMNIQK